MKISTKGKYGLKAMVDIAVNSSEGCVSLKSISNRQGVSEAYLEQLIQPLKKNGLVSIAFQSV
jgi:Rrf2 family protein